MWRASVTEWHRRRRATDVSRWAGENNLHESWRSRTRMLAEHIPPHSVILELGCGGSRTRELLPDSCHYIASDIVSRGPDTFICNLNDASLSALPEHTVVLMSGVLEYVVDVPRLFRHLGQSANTNLLLFSYACRTPDQSRVFRRQLGWMNDLDHGEVLALGAAHNWSCETFGQWQNQSLYAFRRYAQ